MVIRDEVRGDVRFNTDTLGDFVIMRSNGLPVYNFCVAVDDALMKITHVIRAEEHLPNTLRQVCLGNPGPAHLVSMQFGTRPCISSHGAQCRESLKAPAAAWSNSEIAGWFIQAGLMPAPGRRC